MPMLSLTKGCAGYSGFQALFEVSVEVEAGEAVAVIGPNGAGKTTLLRVISKLIGATSGEIRMQGASLARVPAHEVVSRGIAHVPENRRLFPRLTVEENLRMGAFPRAARKRYAERLKFVFSLFPRLKERRLQVAGTLSGGEQQMCAIGRALMSGPKLLLLDEPSAGLAPVVVQASFELMRRICAEGYTVLIVEQNIRQVLMVAALGAMLHQFVIRPVLSAEPINQLLVTGGVLFFLQAAATLVFGIDFRNLGVTLPSVRIGEMSFSAARILAFWIAAAGMAGMYFFLKRSYLGTAIRAISQDRAIMPLMGV